MSLTTVFVREHNVEIYLAKLLEPCDAEQRDTLLSLLVAEQEAMGPIPEHLQNAQRRVLEGRNRIAEQRKALADDEQASQLIRTLELTQARLEQHLMRMLQLMGGSTPKFRRKSLDPQSVANRSEDPSGHA